MGCRETVHDFFVRCLFLSFFCKKCCTGGVKAVLLRSLLWKKAFACQAQVAESVDALVSNTSGAIRAGSTPALGTKQFGKDIVLAELLFSIPFKSLNLQIDIPSEVPPKCGTDLYGASGL